MGARLAHALALRLRRERRPEPSVLVLAGTNPPSRIARAEVLAWMPREALRRRLQSWGGLPAEVLENEEFYALVEALIRCDSELHESLASEPDAPPLDVPLLALAGASDSEAPPASMEGWRKYSTRLPWRPGPGRQPLLSPREAGGGCFAGLARARVDAGRVSSRQTQGC